MKKLLNLLKFIQCPVCRNPHLVDNKSAVICVKCKSKYPKVDNILILIKPNNQYNIRKLWNKTYKYQTYEFSTTPRISQLVRKYTNSNSISLDVGCGIGAYQKDFQGCVLSFDYIPYFVKKAAAYYGSNIRTFLIADANDFPFNNSVFDFELCSQVIEHFRPKESEMLLQNMIRTSRGFIVVDTPNDGNIFIQKLRSIIYSGIPDQTKDKRADIRLQHHRLMGRKDLEKYGFNVHSCIGFVSRHKFNLPFFWSLYDLIMWYFPDFGGNLIGIHKTIGKL